MSNLVVAVGVRSRFPVFSLQCRGCAEVSRLCRAWALCVA